MPGRIAVVDEHNRFVRWEQRKVIHEQRLVHRSVHLLVFDTQNRLLLQLRHRNKDNYPLHWDNSVAGHVEESDYPGAPDEQLDEVYRDVATRELEEELGVTAPIAELAHFKPTAGVHYEQLRLYRATSDGPYQLQTSEVERIQLVTKDEYRSLAASDELLTHSLRFFVDWMGEHGHW